MTKLAIKKKTIFVIKSQFDVDSNTHTCCGGGRLSLASKNSSSSSSSLSPSSSSSEYGTNWGQLPRAGGPLGGSSGRGSSGGKGTSPDTDFLLEFPMERWKKSKQGTLLINQVLINDYTILDFMVLHVELGESIYLMKKASFNQYKRQFLFGLKIDHQDSEIRVD